jgi:hypothetical protein
MAAISTVKAFWGLAWNRVGFQQGQSGSFLIAIHRSCAWAKKYPFRFQVLNPVGPVFLAHVRVESLVCPSYKTCGDQWQG